MKKFVALGLTMAAPAALAHEGHGIDPGALFHYLSAPHAGWVLALAALAVAGLYAARRSKTRR